MALENSSSISTSSSCFFLRVNRFEEERPYIITTCVLNALLFVPNVLGSTLILVTMWKNPNLEMPNHVYLCSLAAADLITGLIVQPLYVMHKIAWLYGNWSMDCIPRVITEIVAWISAAVSCSSIGLISLDRMLALTLHMKYQFYVTRKRALQVTGYIWFSLTILSFSRFFMADIGPFVIFGVVGILIGILQVFVSYLQIYKYMRHHQKKIAVQIAPASLAPSSSCSSDSAAQQPSKAVKVKALWKSAMNLAYVVGLYVIVYLPFVGSLIAFLVNGQTLQVDIFYDLTRTIIFCASVFNPLLYCWKIKDIKIEVLKTLARMTKNVNNNFLSKAANGRLSAASNNDSNIGHNGLRSFTTEFKRGEPTATAHI